MNTNDLTIFIKMYELRSLNQTSKITGYAQSNISSRLKILENEFGNKLFIRTHSGLIPTPFGHSFNKYAHGILNETEKMKSFNKVKHLQTSEILFNYIVLFKEDYSLSDYTFEIQNTSQLINYKLNGAIVIAFYKLTTFFTKITQNHLPVSFLSGKKPKDNIPFLINSDIHCPFRKETLKRIDIKDTLEINSLNNILSIIKKGDGIALLPAYFADMHTLNYYENNEIEIPYFTHMK